MGCITKWLAWPSSMLNTSLTPHGIVGCLYVCRRSPWSAGSICWPRGVRFYQRAGQLQA